MKLKIGTKLYAIREERRLNQEEMADLLGISQSSYSRLERGESSIELDELVRFAKVLQVPIQDFLPETLTIHNENHNGQGGFVVFGELNYHNSHVEEIKQLVSVVQNLVAQVSALLERTKG